MSIASSEDRVNLVPLIDCMFFLILFFLIASRFTAPELKLAALLPTNDGGPGKATTVNETTALRVYPAGFARGGSPRDYQRQWAAMEGVPSVVFAAGNLDPLVIDNAALGRGDAAALDAIHAWVGRVLEGREHPGLGRDAQPPIEIACFSGLPWRDAVAVYDAVLAYEKVHGAPTTKQDPERLRARTVSFTQPIATAYSPAAFGEELYAIVNRR